MPGANWVRSWYDKASALPIPAGAMAVGPVGRFVSRGDSVGARSTKVLLNHQKGVYP
jgi:hypothetical protein